MAAILLSVRGRRPSNNLSRVDANGLVLHLREPIIRKLVHGVLPSRKLGMKFLSSILSLLKPINSPDPLQAAPEGADGHFRRGNQLYLKGDHDGAIAQYRDAVRLKPDEALYHRSIEELLSSRNDLDGDIPEYREAIGKTLDAKGDLSGATAEYRSSIKMNPDCAKVHDNLANMRERIGDT